jgi:DNA invertase Pin-like site-specific DNA recombinase
MRTLAYLRISTDKQELDNQRLAILNYAQQHKIKINEFIEVQASSRKSTKERLLDLLFEKLADGNTLVVSELSRLGRSLGQVIRIVDELIKRKIQVIAIKEGIVLDGKQSLQNKVMVALFGLFAEIERDLISERTKQGLMVAKKKGKLLGRPKGSFSKSKLDGKAVEIQSLLFKGVSKSSIAKIMGVSRTALYAYIESRKLD